MIVHCWRFGCDEPVAYVMEVPVNEPLPSEYLFCTAHAAETRQLMHDAGLGDYYSIRSFGAAA